MSQCCDTAECNQGDNHCRVCSDTNTCVPDAAAPSWATADGVCCATAQVHQTSDGTGCCTLSEPPAVLRFGIVACAPTGSSVHNSCAAVCATVVLLPALHKVLCDTPPAACFNPDKVPDATCSSCECNSLVKAACTGGRTLDADCKCACPAGTSFDGTQCVALCTGTDPTTGLSQYWTGTGARPPGLCGSCCAGRWRPVARLPVAGCAAPAAHGSRIPCHRSQARRAVCAPQRARRAQVQPPNAHPAPAPQPSRAASALGATRCVLRSWAFRSPQAAALTCMCPIASSPQPCRVLMERHQPYLRVGVRWQRPFHWPEPVLDWHRCEPAWSAAAAAACWSALKPKHLGAIVSDRPPASLHMPRVSIVYPMPPPLAGTSCGTCAATCDTCTGGSATQCTSCPSTATLQQDGSCAW